MSQNFEFAKTVFSDRKALVRFVAHIQQLDMESNGAWADLPVWSRAKGKTATDVSDVAEESESRWMAKNVPLLGVK